MRAIGGLVAAALMLNGGALAQPLPTPLARGEIVFLHHDNGLQYPRYAPAPAQTCSTPGDGDQRQRLVDLAAREWARFGYPLSPRADPGVLYARFPELARVKRDPYAERDPLMLRAIGGYWAALSGVASSGVGDIGGYEIVDANTLWRRQAEEYRANTGWRTPWSAAFISWLMCEGGVEGFRRSWAHRDYVDAAIAAADGQARHPYLARETDHAPLVGDLLCSGRAGYRPRDLAARRDDPAPEAEMHCDLVVAIDAPSGLVIAIGGNVDNAVALVPYRLLLVGGRTRVQSVCPNAKLCEDERLFAVLALEAASSGATLARVPGLGVRPAQPPPLFR
jgi:hypothetical protein